MTPPDERRRSRPSRPRSRTRRAPAKAMTIGAVCKALEQEFPDISISKIRYLEDQKLLDAAAHARRLPALQRRRRRAPADDPAPAARRVPAAARDPPGARRRAHRATTRRRPAPRPAAARRARCAARASSVARAPARCTRSTTCSRRRAPRPRLVAELEEYGVIKGEMRGGVKYYDETEREIVARRHRARPLRRRRAQPARVPHVGRPRGGAAAADPGPGAALAQHRAPQGGRRGAREPRRGRRRTSSTCCSSGICARSPADAPPWPSTSAPSSATSRTSRSRGSCSRTSRRCWPTPARSTRRSRALAGGRARGRRHRGRRRGARLPARRRRWPASSAPASSSRASRASCPTRRSARSTCSSTGRTRWSSTPTRSRSGARVLVHDDLLATGGTARALCELVEQLGGEVVGCVLPDRAGVPARARAAGAATRSTRCVAYDAE